MFVARLLVLYVICDVFFFFKQKTAYEMRISDWSSDVCSSDLGHRPFRAETDLRANQGWDRRRARQRQVARPSAARHVQGTCRHQTGRSEHLADRSSTTTRHRPIDHLSRNAPPRRGKAHLNVQIEIGSRSEEHTSELQSLMRPSYAVFCLKKK